ncbi:MAG: 50S ribosomal protein L4, partial [Clostridia bacterium]|nr:50S ribosomal protein L4 [Clostridia bacterium]
RGGGRKPWRQKGTGNARQGSIRAPQWIKGGVVFAPKSRDFSKDMNKKAKVAALISALSKKVADGEVVVIDNLAVKEGKTKEMAAFQKALNLDKSSIVYMDTADEKVILAARNLENLSTLPVEQISVYEVVANAKVVLTKAAVKKIEEAYGE